MATMLGTGSCVQSEPKVASGAVYAAMSAMLSTDSIQTGPRCLEVTLRTLHQQLEAAGCIETQLISIRNRVFGCTPDSNEDAKGVAKPAGEIYQLADYIDLLARQLLRIGDIVQTLDGL